MFNRNLYVYFKNHYNKHAIALYTRNVAFDTIRAVVMMIESVFVINKTLRNVPGIQNQN